MKNIYSVVGVLKDKPSMLSRSHQVTVRLLNEDRARLEKIARILRLSLNDVQIKFVDYLLNNENHYLKKYLDNRLITVDVLLASDVGSSVSVRLNSHTFQVLNRLVRKLNTSKGTLLRAVYIEKFSDVSFIFGADYKTHIDDIDESAMKQ